VGLEDRPVKVVQVVWATSTCSWSFAASSPAISGKRGAADTSASSIPCTSALGIGIPGCTNVSHSSLMRPCGSSRIKAISTMRQLRPKPVVSRSNTANPRAPRGSRDGSGLGWSGSGGDSDVTTAACRGADDRGGGGGGTPGITARPEPDPAGLPGGPEGGTGASGPISGRGAGASLRLVGCACRSGMWRSSQEMIAAGSVNTRGGVRPGSSSRLIPFSRKVLTIRSPSTRQLRALNSSPLPLRLWITRRRSLVLPSALV
jgi:hypothetical protein